MKPKARQALAICIFLLTGCSSPSAITPPATNTASPADTPTVIATEEIVSVPSTDTAAWSHPDGTIHYYEAIAVPEGINWPSANQAASRAGGYLATITSPEENEFVFGLVQGNEFWLKRPTGVLAGPWLGGVQPPGSPEPDGNWQWVSGEPLSYANWSPREPNEMNDSNQNRIHFGEARDIKLSTWNDIPAIHDAIRGYVIEYDAAPSAQPETQFGNLTVLEAQAYVGYTLVAPIQSTTTYLIDLQGEVAHTWDSSYQPAQSAYLLENGNLLRPADADHNGTFAQGAAKGGLVQEIAWDSSILWEFSYGSDQYLPHHDIEPLPNGNILMIVWELKSAQAAIAAGRNADLLPDGVLWPDHIIEVRPTGPSGGEIVWEWHLWDHLIQDADPSQANFGVVADHPELVDINFVQGRGGADWTHINGIAYNADLGQIVLSVHNFNELWVIDHSTTSDEAAGHTGGASGMGGDILYRWGNPSAYGAGTQADQQLFGQHDAQWIANGLPGAGNILIFNNGMGRPEGEYSSIIEIAPPLAQQGNYPMAQGMAFEPVDPRWTYLAQPPASFYSQNISGTQRLPNGNTLICEGAGGRLFEVTASGEVVWEYFNTLSGEAQAGQGSDDHMRYAVFKVRRYAPDYAGFSGVNWEASN